MCQPDWAEDVQGADKAPFMNVWGEFPEKMSTVRRISKGNNPCP